MLSVVLAECGECAAAGNATTMLSYAIACAMGWTNMSQRCRAANGGLGPGPGPMTGRAWAAWLPLPSPRRPPPPCLAKALSLAPVARRQALSLLLQL